MKTIIKHSVIVLFTFLLATQVYGAGAGSVLLLKGKLKIQKVDSFEIYDTPNTKVEVMEQDQIHTGENTRAKIYMRGQKETVHLYAKSFLTLEKVDDEKSQVSILVGKARFVVEPSTSSLSNLRRKFQIRTGNAFIGIRGTDIVAQTNGDLTNVAILIGRAVVANLAQINLIVELSENQATSVRKQAPPTAAITLSADAIENILTSDEAEEWEDMPAEEQPRKSGQQPDEDSLSTVEDVKNDVEDAQDQVRDAATSGVSIGFTVTEQP